MMHKAEKIMMFCTKFMRINQIKVVSQNNTLLQAKSVLTIQQRQKKTAKHNLLHSHYRLARQSTYSLMQHCNKKGKNATIMNLFNLRRSTINTKTK